MKSKVFTSVIFCLLLISNIYAEMIIKVEPMVVTAKKYASSLEETGSNVQVFTREELTQLGAETLKEAMDLSTNIASVSGGGVTSILQRGLASNASKVLWNGVELKDPITPQGTPYLDVLNINDLERIEIIQGASSSLYGSGAMGGVINFIFRKNVSNVFVNYATEKMVTGLNYNTYILDTDLQLNVSSSYDNTLSDLVDTTEKDAKTVQNIRLGVQRDFGRIRTKVLYARNLGVFELDNFFSTVDDPDYQLNSLQNLFSVSTAFKISENLESTLIYNLNSIARDSVNVADDVDATATSSEYRGSTNYVDWRNLWEVSSDINVLFGADLHTENGSSEYITAFYESTFANKAQSVRGAYTHFDYLNPILSMNTGVRLEEYGGNYISTYSLSFFRDVPYLDSVIKINWRTGFRHPSLYEKYDVFSGNENLEAENSVSREVTLIKGLGKTGQASVSYFDYDVTNRINYNSSTWKYENVSGLTKSKGASVAYALRLPAILDFLKTEYTKTYAHTEGEKTLLIPEDKVSFSTGFSYQNFLAGLSLIYVGQRYDYGDVELASYYLVNTKMQWLFSENNRLSLTINNLWNTNYVERSGYATQGRIVSVGYSRGF